MHMHRAKFLTREPEQSRAQRAMVLVPVLHRHPWVHRVASGPAGRDALPVSAGVLGRENAALILNAIRPKSTGEIKSPLYLAPRDGANVLFDVWWHFEEWKVLCCFFIFPTSHDSTLFIFDSYSLSYLIVIGVIGGSCYDFLQRESFLDG